MQSDSCGPIEKNESQTHRQLITFVRAKHNGHKRVCQLSNFPESCIWQGVAKKEKRKRKMEKKQQSPKTG